MMSHWHTRIILAVALVACAVGVGAGQEGRQPGRFSSLIDIDALIDNHCRFLARKYKLTEEQDVYTQQFLRDKADEFLAQHREELFAIADEMFDVRGGSDMTPEELTAWGQRARPIYEQAKALIIEGNDEWREILTDEQKVIHDEDLAQMYHSFATTDDQLERIVSGDMTVEEFRRGPRTPPRPRTTRNREPVVSPQPVTSTVEHAERRAPTPKGNTRPTPQPTERVTRGGEPERLETPTRGSRTERPTRKTPSKRAASKNFESEWEKYVNDFIQRYQLDEAQQQRAQTILKTCQEQATNHMTRKKAALDHLDRLEKDLADAPDKATRAKEINEKRQKLLDPINQIFEKRLKPRLDKLPTRAQREAAESGRSRPTPKPTPRTRASEGDR